MGLFVRPRSVVPLSFSASCSFLAMVLFSCGRSDTNASDAKGNGDIISQGRNDNIVKILKGNLDFNPETKKFDKLVNQRFHCTGWATPEGKVVSAAHCFLGGVPAGAVIQCADGTTLDLEGPFGPLPVDEDALKQKDCTIPLSVLRKEIFQVEAAGKSYTITGVNLAPEFLERNTRRRDASMDLAVVSLVEKLPTSGLKRAASLPGAGTEVEFRGYGLRVDPGYIDADMDLVLNDEDACPLTPFELRFKMNDTGNIMVDPNGNPVTAVDARGCGAGEKERVGKVRSVSDVSKGSGPVLRKGTNTLVGVHDGFLKILGPSTLFPAPKQNLPANGDSGAPLFNKAGEVIGVVHGGRFEFDDGAERPAVNANGIPLVQGLFTDLTNPAVKAFLEASLKK